MCMELESQVALLVQQTLPVQEHVPTAGSVKIDGANINMVHLLEHLPQIKKSLRIPSLGSVLYTYTEASAGAQTIAHGLNSGPPEMIWIKHRTWRMHTGVFTVVKLPQHQHPRVKCHEWCVLHLRLTPTDGTVRAMATTVFWHQ